MNRATLYTLFVLVCCQAFPAWSQSPVLEFADFRQMLLSNHPLSRQAELYLDEAQASLLSAKGGFDPKAYGGYSAKNFNGKTYFQYTEAGMKLPTWAGLELKGAYNLASGNFLNQENNLPSIGQASLGFSWSLGQGLMIDERRAGLQIARAGLVQGEAVRRAARNELVFLAAKSYWDWVYAENAVRIVGEALQQARVRHDALRESFKQGERAAIDTLETFLQLQSRMVEMRFAEMEAGNADVALAPFLWDERGEPLKSGVPIAAPNMMALAASASSMPDLGETLTMALSQHPQLVAYQAKLQQLNVERKWKNEQRKPVFDVSYFLLGNGWQFFTAPGTEGPAVLANDMKWSIDFSYPILNRKARGGLQLAQLKIAQTELELRQKRQDIEAKFRQYANEVETLRGQASLFKEMAENYRKLLDAELERFAIGESSVFLVNTREQRWLDAQVKYLKLLAEQRKAEAGLLWAAGVSE
jgi:outer membrane protein TolC